MCSFRVRRRRAVWGNRPRTTKSPRHRHHLRRSVVARMRHRAIEYRQLQEPAGRHDLSVRIKGDARRIEIDPALARNWIPPESHPDLAQQGFAELGQHHRLAFFQDHVTFVEVRPKVGRVGGRDRRDGGNRCRRTRPGRPRRRPAAQYWRPQSSGCSCRGLPLFDAWPVGPGKDCRHEATEVRRSVWAGCRFDTSGHGGLVARAR